MRFALMIAGLVCFILAAIGVPVPRVNLIGLGLALVTGATML